MSRRTLVPCLILPLLLALAPAPASAALRRPSTPVENAARRAVDLWNALLDRLAVPAGIRKLGPSIDPNGSSGDLGLSIDPNGVVREAPPSGGADLGLGMDPNG
jgi:hypothetical protein